MGKLPILQAVRMTATDVSADHFALSDIGVTRRYFDKFAQITGHLGKVSAVMEAEGNLHPRETEIITGYLVALTFTFRALAHKYHFAGRMAHAGQLTFDRSESGFPVYAELLEMASDAVQAKAHLSSTLSSSALKQKMVETIVRDHRIPTKLQYTLSQRMYYQELIKGAQFWARNTPQIEWVATQGHRRQFYVHWAVYDSQLNLPVIYLMELEDTGSEGLPKDQRRWPEVQSHLMAQSLGGLKLLTIASGFDKDFDDLHPKRLRRFHIGPMYSHAFTKQKGPIRDVLAEAKSPKGEDWALVWTEEDLISERSKPVKTGWFSHAERQIFARDPFAAEPQESGASALYRALIMPERPYQALISRDPPGLRDVRKFVVNKTGKVLSYR
jgi:hypothetical protein